LTFPHGRAQLPAEGLDVRVVGHLEVVDASHDTGEIVVGCVGRIAWPTHDCEHGGQVLKACCTKLVFCIIESVHAGQLTSNR
jgi:hypothetical protein